VTATPSAPAADRPARRPGDGHQLLAAKTVLVTAAAGTGIGSAAALRCAAEGATVAISDRHERRLAEAARSSWMSTVSSASHSRPG
jgi:3-oxoacyl-[acyl-carrier protein] reductase